MDKCHTSNLSAVAKNNSRTRSPEGKLAPFLVSASKATRRLYQNKCYNHSVVLTKNNTGASKPGASGHCECQRREQTLSKYCRHKWRKDQGINCNLHRCYQKWANNICIFNQRHERCRHKGAIVIVVGANRSDQRKFYAVYEEHEYHRCKQRWENQTLYFSKGRKGCRHEGLTVRESNSVIFLKDTSTIGVREKPLWPQVQAEVSKSNFVFLSQGHNPCRHEGETASNAGTSCSEKRKICIFP